MYVENKYRPVFTQCESTSLPEATPPGTVVASVRAMDNDTGPAGEIVYSILRAGSERDFDVDPVSGVIRNNKVCDPFSMFSFVCAENWTHLKQFDAVKMPLTS